MLIAAPVVPAPNTPMAKPRRSLAKEARHIGRADGEGGADEAERQAEEQEVPEFAGVAGEPNRDGATDQQYKHNDPAAEPVRPDAERQSEERAGQDGG